jgi:hypothetical protein
MQLLSHGLPESLQDISATGFDQLYAPSTTTVGFASDKLTQLLITEKLISERQRLRDRYP